jgi:predicted lipoprotein with Yx(FWY)xxD motif
MIRVVLPAATLHRTDLGASMSQSRPLTLLTTAAAIPLSALGLAACGSTSVAAPLPNTNGRVATVGTGATGLGTVLIDRQGRTLYLFTADSGGQSTCSGACALAWPPLLTTADPTAGSGAKASLLGTITRPGGRLQVTYNGHPLYLFVKDHHPGDTFGQGVTAFGASWYALTPSGNQVSGQSPTSGYGGGY